MQKNLRIIPENIKRKDRSGRMREIKTCRQYEMDILYN